MKQASLNLYVPFARLDQNPLRVERSESWLKDKSLGLVNIGLELQSYLTRENSQQNFISSRSGPEKVLKQGRDEITQEDYRASTKVHSRCRVGRLLALFQLCLVSVFFTSVPT